MWWTRWTTTDVDDGCEGGRQMWRRRISMWSTTTDIEDDEERGGRRDGPTMTAMSMITPYLYVFFLSFSFSYHITNIYLQGNLRDDDGKQINEDSGGRI
jgi:hypothetical protein